MPIYSMMNITTDEVFEVNMKYSELDRYLQENVHIKQVYNKFPGTVDPVRLGRKKPDDGFRDALKEVKSHHKKNTINVY